MGRPAESIWYRVSRWCCLLALPLVIGTETGLAQDSKPQEGRYFTQHVASLLAQRCLECHQGDQPEGGLALDRRAGWEAGGDSGVAGGVDGTLLARVMMDEMPPKHPLSEAEKQVLKKWIDEGGQWEGGDLDLFSQTTQQRAGRDWWSLQPLREVPIPKVADEEWNRHPIDAFVWSSLKERGWHPAEPSDPRTLVRRLSFDLLGLPPTWEQIDRLTGDPSQETYEAIVDQMLQSPDYGQRWARHWLDIVRFGESDGFERNFQRDDSWPYRDWIIESLNQDMPYDQFVRMQLIGDLLDPGVQGAAATGFWVAGVHNTVVGANPRMQALARQDELEDILGTMGQAFLGLTLNCARCHDHKFDPVTQQEYYQLVSSISGQGFGTREVKVEEYQQRLQDATVERQKLQQELSEMRQQVRQRVLQSRDRAGETMEAIPALVRWTFDRDLEDQNGFTKTMAVGNAKVVDGGLHLRDGGYVKTDRLPVAIGPKSLEVWAQLDDLQQAGGGLMSLETPGGGNFDAIVFGEREPQKWMAGSNNFVRSDSFQGPSEEEAVQRPVHLVWVYQEDGTIQAYRDGTLYGQPTRPGPLQSYAAGESELLLGLRHEPAGGNRHFSGVILQAAFYDRALSAEEVSAQSSLEPSYVSQEAMAAAMTPQEKLAAESGQRKLQELEHEISRLQEKAIRRFYTLVPTAAARVNVYLRGDPDQLGPEVAPGVTDAIQGVNTEFSLKADAPDAERRRQLAAWVTNPDNGLFHRVIVNRLWHHHFGAGLVSTPSDFGFNGSPVSHPDLLEYLAGELKQSDYRLKALHRLIVTSKTYQQSSKRKDPELEREDGNNRWLWRGNGRRLEAEALRDSILKVSGCLDPTMGGPGYRDVSITLNAGTTYYEPLDQQQPEFWRRTIYRYTPRGDRSALLETFDCPDPSATTPKRSVTTTPLQSLSLLNSRFVLTMAERFAERIESEVGAEPEDQVRVAWQMALGRLPEQQEQVRSVELVKGHGLAALCRALFNLNEFVVID